MEAILYFAGASGNGKGPAAYAYSLTLQNGISYKGFGRVKNASALEAAYVALTEGLRRANRLGVKRIEIVGDRNVVKQLEGSVAVPHGVRRWYATATKLIASFQQHVLKANGGANEEVERMLGTLVEAEAVGGAV